MTTPIPAKPPLIVVEMARAGQFSEIRELFSPALRPILRSAAQLTLSA